MIRTIASVMRGEGLPSAVRRTTERIEGAIRDAALRGRGLFAAITEAAILNVAASGASVRLGGVQTQLTTRLHVEKELRNVALLQPAILETLTAGSHAQRRVANDLEAGIRDAIAITGANTVHFEGMHGVALDGVLRLIASGTDVIVSLHDFSLFCTRPHLLEEPVGHFCFYSQDLHRCHRCLSRTWNVDENAQRDRRTLARGILTSAKGVIFPSQFLLDQHRHLFSLPELAGEVIEPGVTAVRFDAQPVPRQAIAFAGSVKRHKGAHLIPELARLLPNVDLHIFGGGDEELFRAMRDIPNISIHGYYRSGTLPSLLARHGIGLVIVPSIVPESFGLVLSEAWLAGAAIAAFDLGAPADRIRRDGGGWLAPLESGAAGLATIAEQWMSGRISTTTPQAIASPMDAAKTHVAFYRKINLRTSASSADSFFRS